jgi:hypothetical protein
LVQPLRIEAYDHFFPNYGGWGGTAAIFINQVTNGRRVKLDVALLVFDTPSREVGLKPFAGRSARLGEDDNLLFHCCVRRTSVHKRRIYFSLYSMWNVIFAVFCNMAATEQYFSSESRTASSIALCETFPPTR